jgi:hypothetical protein
MKCLACVLLALLACAVVAGLVGGCSGTGAPAVPGDLQALQRIANDNLSAVLMVKRWSIVLHPGTVDTSTATCDSSHEELPPQPGDPSGSRRFRDTYPDCTTAEVLLLADGSATQVVHYADGAEKTVLWGPVIATGSLREVHLQESLWDGSGLDYVFSFRMGSVGTRRQGTAVLGDGRDMAFDHFRSDRRDQLAVDPDDGAHLGLQVPIRHLPGGVYLPAFAQGATGTYEGSGTDRLRFVLSSAADARWEGWEFTAQDGTTGVFTLGADFSGAGELRRDGRLLGTLSWDADAKGQLSPIGAGATDAVPSAAARDFVIDQWIRNIAAMGPMPTY